MPRLRRPRWEDRRAPTLRSDTKLRLPHERDETAQPETPGVRGPRERIHQAARDVARGLVDTEARGTPSNVPSPRRKRKPRTP
jgi:hypothetical protein